ncbi:Crp/Fnr family transcriptional regulator [Novosphingobium sp.]|uniref:Crp/Fnr family transcriptional regulator n=1 Tax=Novosphingobium sp. TaxID=1874826 RepID=UPI0027369387|nr:Crp/Fnr family transcriptional regulator [Novosphingobium sp.]MDP3907703.1 Crp/Fnr family transcriptional regulator [Novosphingobium sp.]
MNRNGQGATLAVVRQAFGCGDDLAVTILTHAREGKLPRGAVLWPIPGREETTLLTGGLVQEVAYGRDGGMLVLHQVGPGEFYGSLVGTAPTDTGAQVEAVVDSQGAHFAANAIVRLMESYAFVGVAMTRQLAARIDAMRVRMVESAMLTATGRICAELLRRARRSPDMTIRPLPVWSELAVSVQSTRETVSRTVSQLEKRGVLRREPGGLVVVAPHRLEEQVY